MIICKNCGAELPDGAKFCTKCGYAIIPEEEILREPQEAQAAADDWNAQAAPAYNPYPAAPQPQEPQYQQPQYQQPQYQQPQYQQQYQQPQYYGQPYQETYTSNYGTAPKASDSEKNDKGRTAMILAIIGAWLGAVPGIILCAIAGGKVKAWEEQYGPATGMAKAAKIIAKVGLILSIISTVVLVLYFILIIAGAATLGSDFWEELFEVLDF